MFRDPYARSLAQVGLVDFEAVMDSQYGEPLKVQRGRRDVVRIKLPPSDVLYLKRNFRPYRKDGIASVLRHGRVRSSARQEWENLSALRQAEISVPELVAIGEECGLLYERRSFIITAAATGLAMDEWLRDCSDPARRRLVLEELGREIRRLHDLGFASRDLFVRHVFVQAQGRVRPTFTFIDLARLDRQRQTSHGLRARDLASLNITAPLTLVTARERLRFLRAYVGLPSTAARGLFSLVRVRVQYLMTKRRYSEFTGRQPPQGLRNKSCAAACFLVFMIGCAAPCFARRGTVQPGSNQRLAGERVSSRIANQ